LKSFFNVVDASAFPGEVDEVGSTVGWHDMDLVRNKTDEVLKEFGSDAHGVLLGQFDISEFACAISGNQETVSIFGDAKFGHVDMK